MTLCCIRFTYPLLILLLIRWLIRCFWLSISNMILGYYCLTRFPGQFFNFQNRFFIQCVAWQRQVLSCSCDNFFRWMFFSFYNGIKNEKLHFCHVHGIKKVFSGHHRTLHVTERDVLQIKSIFSHKLIKFSRQLAGQ